MVDRSAIGRSFTPVHATVEPGRLRYFFNALGERNPIYRDIEAAKAAGYAAIPIPPTYLFCLEMMDAEKPFEFLEALQIDLARVLHGEQHFSYHAPVVVGDTLTFRSHVSDVVDKKGGALTIMNVATEVINQHGRKVAEALHCDPQLGNVMSLQATKELAVGDRVVNKTFPPISRHTLALYCGASGDHNPIHADLDFAKKAGFDDVFAHGMLVMAYLGQALTDAVTPGAIRSFSTRFAAITPLGTKLTCEGEVVELFEAVGEKRVRLSLTARNEKGEIKLAGEAVIAV